MERCKFIYLSSIVLFSFAYGASQAAEKNTCGARIPCDNSQCIERDEWCDGDEDCGDGSDESHCKTKGRWSIIYPDNKCDDKHFVCENMACVPVVVRCDGHKDCSDFTDENNCESLKEDDSNGNGRTGESIMANIDGNANLGISSEMSPTAIPPGPINILSTYTTDRSDQTQKTTTRSIDHYEIRMSERENQRVGYSSVYHQNRQHSPQYNTASDVVPASQFFPNGQVDHRGYERTSQTSRPLPTRPRPSQATTSRVSSRQLWPEVHSPRVIIHTPTKYPGSGRSVPVSDEQKQEQLKLLPPFQFEANYDYSFGNRYSRQVRKAEQWILNMRGDSYSWGEDTPRALVALSLVRNSFLSNFTGYDLMRRRLRLDLGGKLLWNREKPLSNSKLAMYINALLATCQDPRQTFDQNLSKMLYHRTHEFTRIPVSPFVYITLCLTNSSISHQDLTFLKSIVNSSITDEASKDRFILATSALACFRKWDLYRYELDDISRYAFNKLLQQRLDDGSFGSVYSTAIAAQALIAMDSNPNDLYLTLDYLSQNQSNDGSFGDILSTYYALPALAGRSLVHLRNTECERPSESTTQPPIEGPASGPKKSILLSLAIGYPQRSSIALQMTVPLEASIFDIMKSAQNSDPRFKFLYVHHNQKLDVYTISGIPNDPEFGTYWNLYVLDRHNDTVDTSQLYSGDIRELIPADSQELLYWYLPFKLVFPGDRN